MEENKGFEPYIDWESMDEKMVKEFADDYNEFDKAKTSLGESQAKENVIRLMKAQEKLSETDMAIRHALYTVPMMVHVAGPRQESDSDSRLDLVQLCKRCGSVLQGWVHGHLAMTENGAEEISPEDVSWWEEDSLVAKSDSEARMVMYKIDGELDKNEFPCPNLADMGFGNDRP